MFHDFRGAGMSRVSSPTSLVFGDDSLPESLPIVPVMTMPAKKIATNNITIAMIQNDHYGIHCRFLNFLIEAEITYIALNMKINR